MKNVRRTFATLAIVLASTGIFAFNNAGKVVDTFWRNDPSAGTAHDCDVTAATCGEPGETQCVDGQGRQVFIIPDGGTEADCTEYLYTPQ